ncbi:gluconate kinase [Salipaludibacillus keqinensis]|uniref:Gluconate kinase n=1 Tax=Salipaludibacillus keqinensis TaxID=2045207 RepID=A0A323TEL1_9BACI|nr:gluconokinase [Salipaludibacillus keqinensis]PYZ92187.1 gluconate kinase [Salipaludibacillus keqinensis]
MLKQYVIGLDIGTTSAKSVVFLENGTVVAEDEQSYPVFHAQPSWAEQDPLIIEEAVITAFRHSLDKKGIKGEEIISVGLSSAMHSLICVDEKNNPLSPSLTWADGRSVDQASKLKNSAIGTTIYLQSGTPIHPMSPLLKLIWMNETKYQPYQRASKFLSIKEFITSRWFGIDAVDYSIASATGLFDIRKRQWNDQALKLAGIQANQLSIPVSPTYIFQGLCEDVATKLKVPRDLPFAAGGSDGPLANLGIGAIDPGDTAITIGTSGAIRQMANQPKTDEQQQVFCYAFTDHLWILGGPTNNGGVVLQWLKEVLGQKEVEEAFLSGEDAYSLLLRAAEEVLPGSDGLLFLPYLNGERAPHWDANARGAYIGLAMDHQKQHLLRAGLEGVLFSLFNVSEALDRLAGKTTTLYASGGFARSEFWVKMLSDIFGQEVHLPKSHQSSAWGAAWISLLAVDKVKDYSSIKHHIPMKSVVYPTVNNHEIYQKLYPVYRNVYEALKPTFKDLALFRRQH